VADGSEIKLSFSNIVGNTDKVEQQVKIFTEKLSNKYKLSIGYDNSSLATLEKQIKGIEAKMKNVSTNIPAPKIPLPNDKDIELYKTKMQNSLSRLKIGKDKVFANENIQKEVNSFNSELSKFGTTGAKSTKELNSQFDTLRTKTAQVSNGFKNVNKDGYGFTEMLGLAAKKIVIWGISTYAVYGTQRAIQAALVTLKELDTTMVEIAKVTNLSADAMERLKTGSFGAASAYGRTAQDYLKSVAEFSRAGYDTQSEGLSKISLLAQNVGELTGDQANQFLLATDAAYKYKGSQEELTKVLDGTNEIDNRFATSIQKVSDGVTVAGSVASNAGVSIGELSAAVGTMTAITQKSGNEMGRAFRSLLLNVGQIKGEFEDGEVIDDEALSKSAKALNAVGIKVHELKNGVEELRNPMDTLKELANKWNTLSSMEQAPIIESLGGKLRGNALLALVNNFDMYEKQLETYTNASGSAMKENEKRMDSWEAKSNQLKNALDEMWTKTINTNGVKSFIDILTSGTKTLGDIIAKLGTIPTLIGAITIAASTLGKKQGKMYAPLTQVA